MRQQEAITDEPVIHDPPSRISLQLFQAAVIIRFSSGNYKWCSCRMTVPIRLFIWMILLRIWAGVDTAADCRVRYLAWPSQTRARPGFRVAVSLEAALKRRVLRGGRQRSKGQWRRASGHRPPPGECDVCCDCRTDFDRSRVCNRRDAASPSTRSERRPSRRSAQLWNFAGAGKRTATTAPEAPSGRSRISIEPPWAVTT